MLRRREQGSSAAGSLLGSSTHRKWHPLTCPRLHWRFEYQHAQPFSAGSARGPRWAPPLPLLSCSQTPLPPAGQTVHNRSVSSAESPVHQDALAPHGCRHAEHPVGGTAVRAGRAVAMAASCCGVCSAVNGWHVCSQLCRHCLPEHHSATPVGCCAAAWCLQLVQTGVQGHPGGATCTGHTSCSTFCVNAAWQEVGNIVQHVSSDCNSTSAARHYMIQKTAASD